MRKFRGVGLRWELRLCHVIIDNVNAIYDDLIKCGFKESKEILCSEVK